MNRRILIPGLIFLVVLTLVFTTAKSASPDHQHVQQIAPDLTGDVEPASLVPGNYCVSCHLAEDPRLTTVTEWSGGIGKEVNSPCPAATRVHEELYYTERLLLMIDRVEASVTTLPEKTQTRLEGYIQRYGRMLDAPVTSLDAFVSEAQTARYQMNKAYTVLNDLAEAAKLKTVLIYAAAITLVVLGSLAWGLYNTRAVRAGLVSRSRATFWRVAFILAVLVFFILPIFRVPAVEVAMTTTVQQEAQTTLDTAQRAADAADRAQARAWMLARIGTTWSEMDTTQAQLLLEESQAALKTARENDDALWGQSLMVQEVTVGTQIEMETAGLIANDLNAARSRAWALPLIALEWNNLDPEKATALLQAEQDVLTNQSGIYRDLQLRGVALTWGEVDTSKAALAATGIDDPALQAWTFRELALLMDDISLFDRAIEAARGIDDPVQRARALREIAVASGQSALFDEALAALNGVNGASLAYALSDLAAAAGDASLVGQIDSSYPDARVSALIRMGDCQSVMEYAVQIADPYEQARALAAVASAWGNAEAVDRISIPLYRDIALRDVIRKTGNLALVDSISMAYYKVQALVAIGELEAASKLASDLGDTYPLVALAMELVNTDTQASLALIELMSRESDKAIVLRAIAVASQEQSLVEQAQGMALAGRVRGDSLAPSQALLDLAQALLSVNQVYAQPVLQQAYEAAQRIAVR